MTGRVNPAWRASILWHGVSMLPRLRALQPRELLALMQQADAHFERGPLTTGSDRRYPMPGDPEGMTGAQLTAVLVFGLWVYLGEDERAAAGLLGDWGETIRLACVLRPQATARREG